jgi:DNA-binding response OmpR family regulator
MLASSGGPAVLVIEDDVVVRWMLSQLLIEEGRCDVTAIDFDDMTAREEFALVLTDLPARRYVAAEARQWVRLLRDRYPSTPIMVCTAHRQASDESDRLGADGLITKPFDVSQLLSTVQLLTRGSSSLAHDDDAAPPSSLWACSTASSDAPDYRSPP